MADQDNTMLAIRFRVAPEATAVLTEIRFIEGAGPPEKSPTNNILSIQQTSYTPETASSFVFINSLVRIIPNGMPFRRGDSNLDLVIDITDPQLTLSYLFLGGEALPCSDAADANDDGRLDVADPISVLDFLFLGTRELPAPWAPGQDPTDDSLDCQEKY